MSIAYDKLIPNEIMKYSLETSLMSDKILYDIWNWCNEEFGSKFWRWKLYPSLGDKHQVDTFYFKTEEDKVKFILRWL